MPSSYCALVLAVSVLAGCATSPFPREQRKQAAAVSIAEAQANPAGHKGQKVVWGGYVLDVKNNGNGSDLYLLQSPLDNSDAPGPRDASRGRFIAQATGYLDKAVYQFRRVTVLGDLNGLRPVALEPGSGSYPYPVLSVENLYLWPLVQEAPPQPNVGVGFGFSL